MNVPSFESSARCIDVPLGRLRIARLATNGGRQKRDEGGGWQVGQPKGHLQSAKRRGSDGRRWSEERRCRSAAEERRGCRRRRRRNCQSHFFLVSLSSRPSSIALIDQSSFSSARRPFSPVTCTRLSIDSSKRVPRQRRFEIDSRYT